MALENKDARLGKESAVTWRKANGEYKSGIKSVKTKANSVSFYKPLIPSAFPPLRVWGKIWGGWD